ncbi:Hsp20/alpha crystallin family protein [Singulisphaera rosea]
MRPVLRHNGFVPASAVSFNRLDTHFDRVFGEDGGFAARSRPGAPVAVWEDDNHVWIEAELPGVAEKDLELTVHKGTLSVRGERKPAEGRRYLYDSRAYGRFEHVVKLPESVNPESVQATLKDGVLQIELAKAVEAKPKKIEIKSV